MFQRILCLLGIHGRIFKGPSHLKGRFLGTYYYDTVYLCEDCGKEFVKRDV